MKKWMEQFRVEDWVVVWVSIPLLALAAIVPAGLPKVPATLLGGATEVGDNVVIGGNDITGLHEAYDHMKIAAGMFAETVDQLYDALRRTCRHVDPAVNRIAFVKRFETNFMQHSRIPPFSSMSGNPGID